MKKTRHGKILELIENYDVETQEELAGRLREAGFSVTQATVSRDIRELKLSKIPAEDGGQKYVVLHQDDVEMEDKYSRVLKDAYAHMEVAQNLVVMKTVSGMAMAVAAALDNMEFSELVGCIAGDDTIFLATHSTEEARALTEKLQGMIAR